jgi:hypothetical protein
MSYRQRHSLLTFATLAVASSAAAQQGFTPLFDGQTLSGWERHNGTATYAVEEDSIVGRTSEGSPNSFLCTQKEYADFELTFEVKVDDELNSGVQIRSSVCAKTERRVHGPQVEIATNGTAGFIYGEALGTDWLSEDRDDAAAQAAFKNGQWNKYRVVADGKHIRTWVNDVPVADLMDERSGMQRGFIGLQVHGIGRGEGPYEVRWRKILLKEMNR